MRRLVRLVLWVAVALAIPATVAFSPVHHPEPVRWEPQVVAAVRPVHRVQPHVAAALPTPGSGAGLTAVRAALTRLGDPYVWAAAGPDAFDCSGLVVWSFQQAGMVLPHSSQALAGGGQPVSVDQIQPGDVITYYSDASHVGLYVGGGKIVHASTYGVPVAVVPMNNAPIYNVRRYR
jgi:cell wall-associated NlpC family hydrolase